MSWDDFVRTAGELSFDGIEIHNSRSEKITGRGCPGDKATGAAVRRALLDNGLEISCIDVAGDVADRPTDEIDGVFDIAERLHVPYIRLHTVGDKGDDADMTAIINMYKSRAERSGIVILIETMGRYSDTAVLRALLDSYASDNMAALWDFHYPYRVRGESAQQTVTNLGAYIRCVHVRDSSEDGTFTLVGEGSMPMDDLMRALGSVNYSGYLTLEWDSEWMPELSDIGAVCSYFINYMSRFGKAEEERTLYQNKLHTGHYVWQKEALINETFGSVLDRMADEFPDQYAFKYTTLNYTRTYAQFKDDVDRCARALVGMGVRAGTKVAVWATNVPEWYITFWAAAKIGAILVTVNTAYKIHEAEYLLKQSDTHTLVMIENCLDSDYAGIIAELCPELESTKAGQSLHSRRLPFLRNVITVGYSQRGCMTWEQAMARADAVPADKIRRMADAVDIHDVCNMQYTSGTTGFPKGVMLTHFGVVNDGKCIGDRMDLSTADRMMIQVPMFHCFGMVLAMTAAMTHGATLCPIPYFSAKNSLACINQEKITVFHGVPTMFIAMFNHPDYAKTDFSHMRTGIMAGSGCPADLMRRAASPSPEGMNMRGIVSVYGQTESSPGVTMSELDDPLDVRCETVGYSFPHVECKIIDPATGEDLPDGEDGEFVARGYNVMKGYYKMPEATAQAIDADGWLHTGDLARRDPDGNFRITGRLKDMIIRGGENIYPKEIEEFLYTNPKVKDVQVIGVPDKQYGEEICACVILKDGESATEDEMKAFVRASMAKHKVPRYVDFVDSFPMNAAGKILKYRMRDEAKERHGL